MKHARGENNAYKILVVKPEGKRPRRRRQDNIKMELREMGLGGTEWIILTQDIYQRWNFVNKEMNFPIPQYVGKFLSS
jgi:hypothetical protein